MAAIVNTIKTAASIGYRRATLSLDPTMRGAFTDVQLTFLGTASAQPSTTRNHSSLALRLGSDVWLFDCGEATQHRLQHSTVKMGKIEKIFITHTHGDHIFGLIPLLAGLLNGAGGAADGAEDPRDYVPIDLDKPAVEIYGPLGTRAYVRTGLKYTHSLLGSPYVVHELRLPWESPTGDHTEMPPHRVESPSGRNIQQVDGVWPNIYQDARVSVSAAPILHSVPCVGYVVLEADVPGKIDPKKYIPELKRTKTPLTIMSHLQQGGSIELSDGTILHGPPRRPGRKVVVLGDTYDPSAIVPLALNADVVIHEATNAHLPGVDPATKDDETYESVEARTKSRGHSTPQMAGIFAKRVGARRLILNHFSARYAGNDDVDAEARTVMQAIGALAAKEYGGDVVCARDFMSVNVALPAP